MSGHDLLTTDEAQLRKLGERITALRKAAGYTSYEKFANDHDLHRAQYWRYEHGENITFLSLLKLASAFGVTLEHFFKDQF